MMLVLTCNVGLDYSLGLFIGLQWYIWKYLVKFKLYSFKANCQPLVGLNWYYIDVFWFQRRVLLEHLVRIVTLYNASRTHGCKLQDYKPNSCYIVKFEQLTCFAIILLCTSIGVFMIQFIFMSFICQLNPNLHFALICSLCMEMKMHVCCRY
jgi:hypothetical protein